MAVLSPQDRERVRYHLGYLNTSFAGSIQFGLPRPVQTLFIVEDAMTLVVDAFAVDRILRTLKILDDIECRLVTSQRRLSAEQLGDLKTRANEPDLLEREYYRWASRLADQLGVPKYAYSDRSRSMSGAGIIPVKG